MYSQEGKSTFYLGLDFKASLSGVNIDIVY